MHLYLHNVQYYETDKMGIVHHSNYIRWMEEARVDSMSRWGWSYERLEQEQVSSPTVAVSCEYKSSTTFGDLVAIDMKIKKYNGAILEVDYLMTNADTGEVVAIAHSKHCFLGEEGRPLRMQKALPAFHETITRIAKGEEE